MHLWTIEKPSYLYYFQLQTAKCTKTIITKNKQTNNQKQKIKYKNNRTKNKKTKKQNKKQNKKTKNNINKQTKKNIKTKKQNMATTGNSCF
jgi:hypothetical protein